MAEGQIQESTSVPIFELVNREIITLSSEDPSNLIEKISTVGQLYEKLDDATQQERSEFKKSFHESITEAKNMLPIGNSIEQKMILQDINKIEMKLNMKFQKMDMQNEMKKKMESSVLLKEKKYKLI